MAMRNPKKLTEKRELGKDKWYNQMGQVGTSWSTWDKWDKEKGFFRSSCDKWDKDKGSLVPNGTTRPFLRRQRRRASERPRTHQPPPKVETQDPPRLPLFQNARLCVLFWPRASLYGQFCACRHLEEGGGHSCAHALGTAALLPRTAFMLTPDNTLSRHKPSARCSCAVCL